MTKEVFDQIAEGLQEALAMSQCDELVEKVAEAMWMAEDLDPALKSWSVLENTVKNIVRKEARAAIAVALEEAADAVGEVGDHADAGAYINAIRALIAGRGREDGG